jgi:hypothetical protein
MAQVVEQIADLDHAAPLARQDRPRVRHGRH